MCADIIRAVDVSEFTGEISRQAWQRIHDEHHVQAAIIQCWGGGAGGLPGCPGSCGAVGVDPRREK